MQIIKKRKLEGDDIPNGEFGEKVLDGEKKVCSCKRKHADEVI